MGANLTTRRLGPQAETVDSISSTLGWLGTLPVFRDLSSPHLARLAAAVRLVEYPAGHDLSRGEAFRESQPLRVVVHGRVIRGSALQREQNGAWSARCGCVIGLGSVNAWALARGLEGAWTHGSQARHDVHCHTRVWVLELDSADFDEVLGGSEGAVLRERLLSLVPADVDAEPIVERVRHCARLRRASVVRLFRATEIAGAQRLEAGASIALDSETACFVVAGGVEVSSAWGIERLAAGDLESLDRLSSAGRSLRAVDDTIVVQLPLGPVLAHAEGDRPRATLVLTDPEAAIDAGSPGARLVRALEAELDGPIAHVRVAWGAAPTASIDPLSPPDTVSVAPDRSLRTSLRAAIDAYLRDWGPFFDHVVFDTSDVARSEAHCAAVWGAAARLDSARLAYAFDRPEAWSRLPARLGLLPPADVQPVAVLGPSRPAPAAPAEPETKAEDTPEAVVRWLARRFTPVRDVDRSAAREPWPLDAVRIHRDATADDRRWARALTGRRVAIAIGGAGAQSFIAIPFLRRLEQEGVPVDQLGGTSVGAFVSVLYALDGDAGLQRLEQDPRRLLRVVWSGLADNRWLRRWLTEASRGASLEDLPIPTVVVSAEAHDLRARIHTHGPADTACLASGSMPPLAPTFVGETRLVDGAVTASVPAALMRSAGADLVVGIQPIPPVSPDPAWIRPPQSKLGERLRGYNPLLRYWDLARSFLAFARRTAEHGIPHADITFHGSIQRTLAIGFWQARRITDHAETSDDLERAVQATVARWRELCRRDSDRVRVRASSGRVDLAPEPLLVNGPGQATGLSDRAHDSLRRLGRWLDGRSDLRLRATLVIGPDDAGRAVELTDAIEKALDTRRVRVACVVSSRTSPRLDLTLEAN